MSHTAKTSLRVLHVTAPARNGGLESVVVQLCAGLRARGHDAQVAAIITPGTDQEHPFLEALERRSVPVHRLVLGSRAYVRECRAVTALGRRLDAHVLHTHGYRADILHGRTAAAVRAPHVMTLHGFVSGNWRDRLYERLQIRAAAKAGGVIAVSSPIVERLRDHHVQSNVHLIRNALGPAHEPLDRGEARRQLGLPADAHLVGWVGRVSEEKGPDLFVEALANSAQHVGGVLMGDGAMMEIVLAKAARLGVRDRLFAVGSIPEANRYFAAFDALALTSRTEGTPMVMLEAMQAGIPLVVTMVGGIPDIVGSDDAWCCAPGDTRALGRAFGEAIEKGADTAARVASSQLIVKKRFGLQSWLEKHERLYDSLIESINAR